MLVDLSADLTTDQAGPPLPELVLEPCQVAAPLQKGELVEVRVPAVGANCDFQRSDRSRDRPPSAELLGPPAGDGSSPGAEEPPETVPEVVGPLVPDRIGCEENGTTPGGKSPVEFLSPSLGDLG